MEALAKLVLLTMVASFTNTPSKYQRILSAAMSRTTTRCFHWPAVSKDTEGT
ncbi:MAG: hypothetical protein BWY91_02358 [bacterium ADurb.BinA028]|nr:MAG: hypothetical protein BWY91_02358 [bacterium ADurb.BinA028]